MDKHNKPSALNPSDKLSPTVYTDRLSPLGYTDRVSPMGHSDWLSPQGYSDWVQTRSRPDGGRDVQVLPLSPTEGGRDVRVRGGHRNGTSRPASTGVYCALWESRLHELMELLTRTSLETHKLDMMAEISSLKIKLASSDKDRRELDERLKFSQRQIKEVESKMALKDAEITELRQRLVRNGTVLTPDSNEYEVEKLKKAVDALMFSNQEKDKRIDELRKLLKRYRKIEEMVIQAQGRKALEDMIISAEDDTSSTSSTTPSVSDSVPRDQHEGYDRHHPSATSTPVHSYLDNGNNTPSPSSQMSTPSHRTPGIQRSNSAEDVTPTNQKKKPVSNNNHQEGYSNGSNNNSFGTLPKDRVQSADLDHTEVRKSRGFPSLGKSLFRVKTGKRSTSAPNLGDGNTTIENVPVKSR